MIGKKNIYLSSSFEILEVLERVTEWRKHIPNGLGITEPPLWNEDANQTPYYTDKPDWDGITALQLFVLAKMFGEPVPETIEPTSNSITLLLEWLID